jgi:seryl-tRNA synthetase
MLDADFVRENLGCVRAMIVARNQDPAKVLRNFQSCDAQRREAITAHQTLLAERNRITEEIEARKGKDIKELIARAKELKAQIPGAEETARLLDNEFMDIMAGIPNMPQGFLEQYNHDRAVENVALLEEICEEIKREQADAAAALRPLPQEV